MVKLRHFVVLCLISLLALPVFAQEDDGGVPIQLSGSVESVEGTVVVVEGLQIDISGLDLGVVEVGSTIDVDGNLDAGVVIATTVVIITLPDGSVPPGVSGSDDGSGAQEPEVTAEPEDVTPTPAPTTSTGTVINISNPIIVIEGPVTQIAASSITVFDIDIEVEPSDPILNQVVIGDLVRVEGETVPRNNTIVIVAINIVIIEVEVIIINTNVINPNIITGWTAPVPVVVTGGLPANCKITPKGKITCKRTRK